MRAIGRRLIPGMPLGALLLAVLLASCAGGEAGPASRGAGPVASPGTTLASVARQDTDQFQVIDCKLPQQVRRLGGRMTYMAGRRVIKTSAGECELRGGEYIAYDRADLGTAISFWMEEAQGGDPTAQNYVGEIFERGVGGAAADHASAAVWYRRAAEQGFAPAQINLGQLYEQGLGVPKDNAEALNWYRRASGLGVTFVAAGDVAAEVTTLREQVSERDRALEELRGELRELQRQLGDERTRREQTQAARDEARRELEAGRRQLDEQRRRIAEDRRQLLPEAPDLVAEREAVAARAGELADREATLKAWQEQVASREQAVAGRERDLAALEADLAEARRQLGETEAAIAARNAALNAERARLAAAGAGTAQLAEREAELGRLGEILAARRAEIEARAAQIDALQGGLTERALGDAVRVAAAMAEVRSKLQAGEAALEAERRRVAEQERRLAEREQALGATSAAAEARLAELRERERAVATQDSELRQREQKLADWESQLARQDSEITTLRRETQGRLADLASLLGGALELPEPAASPGARSDAVAGPPVIRLIDPPLDPVTRGQGPVVAVRSGVAARTIIGKVESTARLASLLVNEARQSADETGIFTVDVPLARGAETPVQIVAVDHEGRRSEVSFVLRQERTPGGTIVDMAAVGAEAASMPAVDPGGLDFGRFHALVIGNNGYRHVPTLTTAQNDARAIADVLRQRYGFEVKVLLDADRYAILSALNELRASLTENDNLLIYYAGHGELDRVNQRGHWLPVDAEATSTANWISNVEISDILNAMSARRVFVVADSCYSGTLTRSSLARLDAGMSAEARRAWLKTMAEKRARVALTSGALTPVLDQGGGGHSIFARALVDVLQSNTDVLEGQRLHHEVSVRVTYAADAYRFEQVPQYAPIKFAGHEAGEFFLVPRERARAVSSAPTPAADPAGS